MSSSALLLPVGLNGKYSHIGEKVKGKHMNIIELETTLLLDCGALSH